MQCEEAELYLAQWAFGDLDPETDQAMQLQGHLDICDACREKLGDLRVTASLIAESADAEPKPRLSDQRRAALVKRFRGIDKPHADHTEPFRFPWRPVGIAASIAMMGFAGLGLLSQTIRSPSEAVGFISMYQGDDALYEAETNARANRAVDRANATTRHAELNGGWIARGSGNGRVGGSAVSQTESVPGGFTEGDNLQLSLLDKSGSVDGVATGTVLRNELGHDASRQLKEYAQFEVGGKTSISGKKSDRWQKTTTASAGERASRAVQNIREGNKATYERDGDVRDEVAAADKPLVPDFTDAPAFDLDSTIAADPASGGSASSPFDDAGGSDRLASKKNSRREMLKRLREKPRGSATFFGIPMDGAKAEKEAPASEAKRVIEDERANSRYDEEPAEASIARPAHPKTSPSRGPVPINAPVVANPKPPAKTPPPNITANEESLVELTDAKQKELLPLVGISGGGGGGKLDPFGTTKGEKDAQKYDKKEEKKRLNFTIPGAQALPPVVTEGGPSDADHSGKDYADDDKDLRKDLDGKTEYRSWFGNLNKGTQQAGQGQAQGDEAEIVSGGLIVRKPKPTPPRELINPQKSIRETKPGSVVTRDHAPNTDPLKSKSESIFKERKGPSVDKLVDLEKIQENHKKRGAENEDQLGHRPSTLSKLPGKDPNAKSPGLKWAYKSFEAETAEREEDEKRNTVARAKVVQSLLSDADELRGALNYEKALEKTEELLYLEPDNIAARAMKQSMEQALVTQTYDGIIARRGLDQNKLNQENQNEVVPYRGVLVYPTDWPQLSLLRRSLTTEEEMSTRRAMEKLKLPMALKYKDQSLEGVIESYRNTTGLDVVVDWEALEQAGVQRSSSVSLSLSAAPAGKALDLILKQGGGGVLNYGVEEGVVTVTSSQKLARQAALRSYNVGDLLGHVPAAQQDQYLGGLMAQFKGLDAHIEPLNGSLVVRANAHDHQAIQKRLNVLRQNAQIKARDLARAKEADDKLPPASKFKQMPVNPFVMSKLDRFSTFGIDTDTASYTLARRFIRSGYKPPVGAVRMEEFVNSFDYNYPSQGGRLFTTHAEAGAAPFGSKLTLIKVGVQAKTIGRAARKPAHLVFLVDASGSMDRADRLPLAKFALKTLVGQLGASDRITLIAYGTKTHLVLDGAAATDQKRIAKALDAIQPGRSTNMIDALGTAYAQAKRHFKAGQINRVILCSDGVATIGATDAEAMLKRVEADRKHGVTLTTVGFGVGGYNDQLMEQLANRGDGQYVFIDSQAEAKRVFVDQLGATLQTVAKDAKIQVEFNPSRVRRYRLIGYENRDIADKDFRNDKVDAGEVGSGQSATALYEVELIGRAGHEAERDLGTVRIRYRDLETNKIQEIAHRLSSQLVRTRTPKNDPRFFLAASAAEFAEILRKSDHARDGRLAHVRRVMEGVVAALPLDKKAAELLKLIRSTEGLPDAP